jgi:hypothetical protein
MAAAAAALRQRSVGIGGNAAAAVRHQHGGGSSSTAAFFFERSIPVWNRLSYPTYVGIQYRQKIVLIRNQYILHTYIRT